MRPDSLVRLWRCVNPLLTYFLTDLILILSQLANERVRATFKSLQYWRFLQRAFQGYCCILLINAVQRIHSSKQAFFS